MNIWLTKSIAYYLSTIIFFPQVLAISMLLLEKNESFASLVIYLKLHFTKENFYNYIAKMPSFSPQVQRVLISLPFYSFILSNVTAHSLWNVTLQITSMPSLWYFQPLPSFLTIKGNW